MRNPDKYDYFSHMTKHSLSLLAAIVLIAFARCGDDKPEELVGPSNIVWGYVWEKGTEKPIVGAHVGIISTYSSSHHYSDSTDNEGRYGIENIDLGEIQITVQAPGYKTVKPFVNHEGQTKRDFELTPDST